MVGIKDRKRTATSAVPIHGVIDHNLDRAQAFQLVAEAPQGLAINDVVRIGPPRHLPPSKAVVLPVSVVRQVEFQGPEVRKARNGFRGKVFLRDVEVQGGDALQGGDAVRGMGKIRARELAECLVVAVWKDERVDGEEDGHAGYPHSTRSACEAEEAFFGGEESLSPYHGSACGGDCAFDDDALWTIHDIPGNFIEDFLW